jgi:ribonuclease HII
MTPPIIGVDEVGTGAIAGPVLVTAFAAPNADWNLPGLDDSKKLTRYPRWALGKLLMREFEDNHETIWIPRDEIDERGLHECVRAATAEACYRLIERVGIPERVILDGSGPVPIQGAETYPKADGIYPAVMAASVIAKVTRDEHMAFWAIEYPQYGFEFNAGYGTDYHKAAIYNHGITPIHRRSVRTIKEYLGVEPPAEPVIRTLNPPRYELPLSPER